MPSPFLTVDENYNEIIENINDAANKAFRKRNPYSNRKIRNAWWNTDC